MVVSEALVHVKNALLLSWLLMSLLLSGWPPTVHCQYHNPPEVVTPLRVTGTGRGIRTPGWLSYSLHFGGQRHIVHMKAKKFLVSNDFSVYTYTDQGSLVKDQPFVQDDCYYRGFVEGVPESLVTLNTCFGGFQGMLQINGIAYDIKPKVLSTTFEHLIYKIDSKETQSQLSCAITEEEIAQKIKLRENVNTTLMQSSYLDWYIHRWFLELALVVDHGRFVYRKKNVTNVQIDMIISVHLVNDIYDSMDLDVILMGLEIWTTGNPYRTHDPTKMVRNFCRWKEAGFNARVKHDASFVVAKQDLCNNISAATYPLGVCTTNLNCGLTCAMDDRLFHYRTLLAQEIGHIMGIANDVESCTCGREFCVMNPHRYPSDVFSNCSYALFWDLIVQKSCLKNTPYSQNRITMIRCGNGVVEEGEQCDCGSTKLCAEDPCCLQNCTLKPGSDCALGLCCQNCKFKPSGTVCREQESECDLPEWCNGTWPKCPDDVYVEDGIPCMDNGVCFQKRCTSKDGQCKEIFGKEAKNANRICYSEINTRGNRFGHCGMENTRYVPCNISDILCGRILCENVREVPFLEDHNTVHWDQINGTTCWSTDYHFGMTIPDIGEVRNGTVCGKDRRCFRKKCVRMPLWEEGCLPDFCNKRGICNNKHHCHCNYMWAPPNCTKKGYGGSIDSGPPPIYVYVRYPVLPLIGIWLIGLLACPTCFFLIFAAVYRKKQKEEIFETTPMTQVQNVEATPTPSKENQGPKDQVQKKSKTTVKEKKKTAQIPPGMTQRATSTAHKKLSGATSTAHKKLSGATSTAHKKLSGATSTAHKKLSVTEMVKEQKDQALPKN